MKASFVTVWIILSLAAVTAIKISHAQELVAWLRSGGGFFHQELGLENTNHSVRIYAKSLIPMGEVVLTIPSEFLLGDAADSICDTAELLFSEMRKQEGSRFWPWIHYLLDTQPRNQLPAFWTHAGKALLLTLLRDSHAGSALPSSVNFNYSVCSVTQLDPLGIFAYELVLSRGWDGLLIPIADILNHRNGDWFNVDFETDLSDHSDIIYRASKDINAGDELYGSYNLCNACSGRRRNYGTPELLLDYGFVELLPQRWTFYKNVVAFDLLAAKNGKGELEVQWLRGNGPTVEMVQSLQNSLMRLDALGNQHRLGVDVPKAEMQTFMKYYEAVTTALVHAIAAVQYERMKVMSHCLNNTLEGVNCNTGALEPFFNDSGDDEWYHYEFSTDERGYHEHCCGRNRSWSFPEYGRVENVSSAHQKMRFLADSRTRDSCLFIGSICQICASYRAHYHETFVHFPARYLNSVKRVLFVGGGDSMLLHELLKYPSVELIVGLEIDQQVTRSCFKHFGTQPHWNKDEVEWWYGDASKSLLMLPKEYYRSFDLVLLDLSQTATSNSITEGLDIFSALSLLLQPDGIIVKNELYFETFNRLFDYSLQVYFEDWPVICEQAFALGSYGVDFLRKKPRQHKITGDNLFIQPLNGTESVYQHWHDYQRNSTPLDITSAVNRLTKERGEQKITTGVILILEAEEALQIETPEALYAVIVAALTAEDFSVVSESLTYSAEGHRIQVVVVTNEGYVVARTWAEHNYVAFDVHLWNQIERLRSVKTALLAAVKSGDSSSFRLVAGSIGVGTEESQIRGSKVLDGEYSETIWSDDCARINFEASLTTSLSLVCNSLFTAVLICGQRSEACETASSLIENRLIAHILPIWACDQDALWCEATVHLQLWDFVKRVGRINAVVIDSSASIWMGKVLRAVLTHGNRVAFFSRELVILTLVYSTSKAWHRFFLDSIRRSTPIEPVFMSQITVKDAVRSLKIGIVSSGDTQFIHRVEQVAKKIRENTGVISEVESIHGGSFNRSRYSDKNYKLKQPPVLRAEEYDVTSSVTQWKSQRPLARQTVFQLEPMKKSTFFRHLRIKVGDKVFVARDGDIFEHLGLKPHAAIVTALHSNGTYDVLHIHTPRTHRRGLQSDQLSRHYSQEDCNRIVLEQRLLTSKGIEVALTSALFSSSFRGASSAKIRTFADIGDGSITLAVWVGGTVIVLWDGRIHIDVNLFTYEGGVVETDAFLSLLVRCPELNFLGTVLRDDFPRGTGRVVNFVKGNYPIWAPDNARDDYNRFSLIRRVARKGQRPL